MGLIDSAAGWLGRALQPLVFASQDPASVIAFTEQLGWTLPSAPPVLLGLAGDLTSVQSSVAELGAVRQGVEAGDLPASQLADAEQQLTVDLLLAATGLHGLADGLRAGLPAAFVSETGIDVAFETRLWDWLICTDLARWAPAAFRLLHILGIVEETDEPTDPGHHQPAFTLRVIRWDRVSLLQHPGALARDVYGWGTPVLDADRLFTELIPLSFALGTPAERHYPDPAFTGAVAPGASEQAAGPGPQLWIPVLRSDIGSLQIGVHPRPTAGAAENQALVVTLAPGGALDQEIPLSDTLALSVEGATEIGGGAALMLSPDHDPAVILDVGGTSTALTSGRIAAHVTRRPAAGDTSAGNNAGPDPSGPALQLRTVALGVGAEVTAAAHPDVFVEFRVDDGSLRLAPPDGDGLLTALLPAGGITAPFTASVRWSNHGLAFTGSADLTTRLPLSISIGPLGLREIELGLAASGQAVSAEARATMATSIGPIALEIQGLGIRLDVQPGPGSLGPFGLTTDAVPPDGIGLSIDAGAVTGGGVLAHAQDEYGGALDLTIGDVAVKAYGLVQTRLPGGLPGYTLIAVISTEFLPPVELPFGFTLEGVGGLIGVNRTIDENAVRSALWAHHLDGLLFPADPVAAAPRLLTALDSYFPGAQGRYVFGPLAKLGWGGLVDGEVALLLELPEPVKLLLIGEIQALVPSVAPQLRLHLSFDGGIDFGKKLAFFDASLHDSYITAYPISGDLAFRYGWGSDAALALALGGFNPHFQPPPGFPALKRLAITISSSVAQIQAQAYLALTSNTLQFGARMELTAGTGGFNVHGWLGFDALCERDPLSFEFDLSAGVDLRHGTDVLASVHLDGKLSGPAPWHISGDASISLLFFDVSVHFDKTWGDEAPQVAAPDPLPVVLAALCDRSGWSGALAASARAVVTTFGNPADAGDAVLLDPAGSLRIAQRAIPLGQPVTRFGGTPLGRTVQLTFDDLTVLGAAVTDPAPATEEFAPGQFLDLSDADRLSLPSFNPMDAGVEVGATAVDLGSGNRARAVATPFEYDTTIVDTQAQRPGTGYAIAETALLAFNARTQGAAPGLARYAPPAGAPPLVALAPERWVVAGTADLALHADVATDGSKLGTKLALGTYLAANPSAAGELQVVLAAEAA